MMMIDNNNGGEIKGDNKDDNKKRRQIDHSIYSYSIKKQQQSNQQFFLKNIYPSLLPLLQETRGLLHLEALPGELDDAWAWLPDPRLKLVSCRVLLKLQVPRVKEILEAFPFLQLRQTVLQALP